MDKLVRVLSLLAINPHNQVLLGQRSKRTRHPFVLSTITMEITPEEATAVQSSDVPMIRRLLLKMVSERLSGADSLMGTIEKVSVLTKLVEDPQGTGEAEWTEMTTVQVRVLNDWTPVPNPRYYLNAGWHDVDLFKAAYDSRDPQLLLPDANPWTLCMHGACVEGAMKLLWPMAKSPVSVIMNSPKRILII